MEEGGGLRIESQRGAIGRQFGHSHVDTRRKNTCILSRRAIPQHVLFLKHQHAHRRLALFDGKRRAQSGYTAADDHHVNGLQ